MKKLVKKQDGQSIVEVIIALAIFVIIAATAVITVLGALSAGRLAKEETQANMLSIEGIEAAQSIRNQGWDNLSEGDHGIIISGDQWVFSGTSDVTGEKFTRIVNVSAVQRDVNGDIVSSGGTNDKETKLITSTVSWNFTPSRQRTLNNQIYLTNWQKALSPGTFPTSTPTPPVVETCLSYCINLGYTSGTCRQNANICLQSGETHESAGDQYCTGGASADTCCCAP